MSVAQNVWKPLLYCLPGIGVFMQRLHDTLLYTGQLHSANYVTSDSNWFHQN